MQSFLKKIYDRPTVVLIFIYLGVLCFLIFTFKIGGKFKWENCADLIWARIGTIPSVLILISIFFIVMLFFWYKDKKVDIIKVMMVAAIFSSIIPIASGMMMLVASENYMSVGNFNEHGRWFNENAPVAKIAFEDRATLVDSLGNKNGRWAWGAMYADLIFWCPDCEITIVDSNDMIKYELPPYDKNVDYIFTAQWLVPEYINKIKSWVIQYPQGNLTWNLYKII